MKQISALASVSVLAAFLSGCAGEEPSAQAAAAEEAKASKPVRTTYDAANGCYALKSEATGEFVIRAGGGYYAGTPTLAGAERFFMKPAGLGRYIFYAADRTYLTADAGRGNVTAATAPSDGADLRLDLVGKGIFAVRSPAFGNAVATDGTGLLVMSEVPGRFSFVPAEGCTTYPEMPVGIPGETFKNRAGAPVIGFAEVHAHMGMGSEMSDGSENIGPSAGGVMYGQAINRFGVVEALKDCSGPHGENGGMSPEWLILDGGDFEHAEHDTQGWPTFRDWPLRDSQLHQQMYYKWVERAYKAGLRTMVVLGTNIEALCDIAKQTGNDKDADLEDTDCTDMGVGMKQVQYLYDIEKYVDAQEGGPGKGWFRIVGDPAEARAVIAKGKLAVIPGLEFSNIFHCNVIYNPDGTETHGCTKAEIDQQIDEIWDLGVRAVFPYHDVDSALGGTGIFSSVLNEVGFYGTRGFWKMYPCEDGGEGPNFLPDYEAGAVMESAPLTSQEDPISQAIIALGAGRLPIYGPGRQCNARTVTDLGKYAIRKIMEKGFTIDIDHAEIKSKQYMLDEGAKLTPNYPMISGHGGHGGINNEQMKQIIRQGGIVYPALKNGQNMVEFMNRLRPLWSASGTSRPFAVGYGADSNGLHNLPGPRGAGATPVTYPFTLFSGAGWGPQFQQAGIRPLTINLLAIPGGRSWNVNRHDEAADSTMNDLDNQFGNRFVDDTRTGGGMDHYGLVPDIVEEMRIEGGEPATTAFYRSAETYLQLWEQTFAAAAAARQQTP